jgi:hypothetical protein
METKAHQVRMVHPVPQVQLDPQVQWLLYENNDHNNQNTSNKVSSNKDIRTSTESH